MQRRLHHPYQQGWKSRDRDGKEELRMQRQGRGEKRLQISQKGVFLFKIQPDIATPRQC